MSELRDEIAREVLKAHHESGRGIAPSWESLDRFEQARWLEVADRILAMPEIAEALDTHRRAMAVLETANRRDERLSKKIGPRGRLSRFVTKSASPA